MLYEGDSKGSLSLCSRVAFPTTRRDYIIYRNKRQKQRGRK